MLLNEDIYVAMYRGRGVLQRGNGYMGIVIGLRTAPWFQTPNDNIVTGVAGAFNPQHPIHVLHEVTIWAMVWTEAISVVHQVATTKLGDCG